MPGGDGVTDLATKAGASDEESPIDAVDENEIDANELGESALAESGDADVSETGEEADSLEDSAPTDDDADEADAEPADVVDEADLIDSTESIEGDAEPADSMAHPADGAEAVDQAPLAEGSLAQADDEDPDEAEAQAEAVDAQAVDADPLEAATVDADVDDETAEPGVATALDEADAADVEPAAEPIDDVSPLVEDGAEAEAADEDLDDSEAAESDLVDADAIDADPAESELANPSAVEPDAPAAGSAAEADAADTAADDTVALPEHDSPAEHDDLDSNSETVPLGAAAASAVATQPSAAAGSTSAETAVYEWAPAEKAPHKSRKRLWIGLAAGVAVVGLVASSLVLIAPGTSVAGVPVGGLTAGRGGRHTSAASRRHGDRPGR